MRRPSVGSLVRRGKRTVLLTYPGLRLGNYLYFALHAYNEQARGRDYRVLDTGLGEEWFEVFPGLRPLFVRPGDLRVRDRRENIPRLFFQEFGVDFTRRQLDDFVRAVIASEPCLRDAGNPSAQGGAGDVTINVRRGDYYADPDFRGLFGFEVEPYLDAALREIEAGASITSIHLVSDDLPWCHATLDHIGQVRQRSVSSGADRDPVRDFLEVAAARRLVITNSTFSYWGAYVSAVIHGDDHLGVWAPRLHSRAVRGGEPWQHDPGWNVVEPVGTNVAQS